MDTKRDPNYEDPHVVQLSKVGKAPQLQLSEDRLSVTGYKGFRTARCSHGVHEGTWYCEVTISRLGSTGHARVGWCTKRAELQAPVGYDTFGYCYRDLEGSKVTAGKREAYGQPFKEGDVVRHRHRASAAIPACMAVPTHVGSGIQSRDWWDG